MSGFTGKNAFGAGFRRQVASMAHSKTSSTIEHLKKQLKQLEKSGPSKVGWTVDQAKAARADKRHLRKDLSDWSHHTPEEREIESKKRWDAYVSERDKELDWGTGNQHFDRKRALENIRLPSSWEDRERDLTEKGKSPEQIKSAKHQWGRKLRTMAGEGDLGAKLVLRRHQLKTGPDKKGGHKLGGEGHSWRKDRLAHLDKLIAFGKKTRADFHKKWDDAKASMEPIMKEIRKYDGMELRRVPDYRGRLTKQKWFYKGKPAGHMATGRSEAIQAKHDLDRKLKSFREEDQRNKGGRYRNQQAWGGLDIEDLGPGLRSARHVGLGEETFGTEEDLKAFNRDKRIAGYENPEEGLRKETQENLERHNRRLENVKQRIDRSQAQLLRERGAGEADVKRPWRSRLIVISISQARALNQGHRKNILALISYKSIGISMEINYRRS